MVIVLCNIVPFYVPRTYSCPPEYNFLILTIILCYYFLNDSFKNKLTLFISLLIISFDPNFLKHAFNGMETSFTYFLSYLILLGIIYSGKIKNNYFMGAIFGIFLLVRPESGLLSILTIIYLLFSRKIGLKGVIQILVSGLIIVLPWIIFTYLYMGKLLPDTFGAKGGDYTLGLNLFKNLISIARIFAGNYFPIFILALIFITKTPKFFKKEELKNMIIFLVVGMYILFIQLFSTMTLFTQDICVYIPVFYNVFHIICRIFITGCQEIKHCARLCFYDIIDYRVYNFPNG